MSRVIIVSNRLPLSVRPRRGESSSSSSLSPSSSSSRVVPSAGGLATALGAAHQESTIWIGWPGELPRMSRRERSLLEDELEAARLIPVHLSATEVAQYYDGFSNGVLWPLLHYLIESVHLDSAPPFEIYREVNQRFAERAAAACKPGDVIWVHDYQLALVPRLLRDLLRRRSSSTSDEATLPKIGFFLHVPFPSPEVFATLPWRREILRGILGADLIGFHTEGYAKNFRATVAEILPSSSYEHGEAAALDTRAQAHPIGIDVTDFERIASSAEVEAELQRLRMAARGRKIILGVDRLDYTKGILRRLMAFDRLLEEEPDLREKVLFVQVGVPSREKVEAYASLRRRVNELVGRINAHHGSATSVPVRFVYRSLSKTNLIALYRAADVMLVTPLRDGMNLVCKEYVATRIDDSGVLVLSELAGAAVELREALAVNPYDLTGIVHALKAALTMPRKEQSRRMRALRHQVARVDVHTWAKRFLRELEQHATAATAAAAE